MIASDRTPVPGRSPAPRRVPPDPPTRKITPATVAAAVGDQDGDSRFGLSVTQIVASTAAAVTAAVIGSRLGVAGTLTGAALASVVSAVGAAVFGHSLLVTRRHMTRALRLVRPAGATPATPAAATPAATGAAGRRTSRPTVPGPYDDPTVVIPKAGVPPQRAARRSRRPLIMVLAAAAAAALVFAASLAAVTLLETVKGGPLSGGTGLSIHGGNTSPNQQPTTDPTTVTVTTSSTPRTSNPAATATVTQTLTKGGDRNTFERGHQASPSRRCAGAVTCSVSGRLGSSSSALAWSWAVGRV